MLGPVVLGLVVLGLCIRSRSVKSRCVGVLSRYLGWSGSRCMGVLGLGVLVLGVYQYVVGM